MNRPSAALLPPLLLFSIAVGVCVWGERRKHWNHQHTQEQAASLIHVMCNCIVWYVGIVASAVSDGTQSKALLCCKYKYRKTTYVYVDNI